jgi:cyclopropane fatty-acyl-phospholipid synthase-like methyltransferase
MKSRRIDFDGLAAFYRPLELLAFGRDLERARFCFINELRDCRRILVLGEGDGRFLARLVRTVPGAWIHCVDSSPAMQELAISRISGTGAEGRVTFEQADMLSGSLDPGTYDAVVTLFFLDCFTPEQVAAVVARVRQGLRGCARWLFADFALPRRGILRLRARIWLKVLYLFFGWSTSMAVRSLPPSEDILMKSGFRRVATRDFQWGLVRSAVFVLPDCGIAPPHCEPLPVER